MAGMVERKMRFSQQGWKLIQQQAREEGISATEFVRTAAVLYAVYLRTLRSGQNDLLTDLLEQAKALT